MCTYSIMTSVTKKLILLTAIIAVSGEALDLRIDTDRTDGQVSDTPYSVKRDPLYTRRCDGIIGFLGCITTDRSLFYPINRDYYDVIRLKDPSSTNTEYIVSKHGSWRERRQALVKTKGSDDGPHTVVPLTRSSSPLRSMIRNRNRRSSSIPDISSNKNTTVRPKPVSSPPPNPSIGKNLIITFLTAISSPYLLVY